MNSEANPAAVAAAQAADPAPAQPAAPPTPYERVGGEATVRRIVERFYDLMDSDAAVASLRRMHAADLAPMRERLTDFMVGWLGGPPRYFQRPDAKCMGQAHAPFAIDAAIREQWLSCMVRALDEAQLEEGLRALIRTALGRMTEGMRNR